MLVTHTKLLINVFPVKFSQTANVTRVLAPELISDIGSYLHPTKVSDIYSFSILAYEVAFIREPWPAVNMQLIESVRRGNRPVVPNNASTLVLFPHYCRTVGSMIAYHTQVLCMCHSPSKITWNHHLHKFLLKIPVT